LPGICCLAGEIADNKQLLPSMAESIKHEDWQRIDTYNSPFCGIARVHLGIFNPEPQPIFNEDKSLGIFFDGKIYDYEGEKKRLQKKGHTFRFADNDAEFCLHLYEELGKDFVKQLNGAFTVFICDEKKQRLLVANDRFGLRPLYYTTDGKGLLIASEVKALLKVMPNRELNDEALADWLTFGKLLGNKTFFQNINVLSPASVLEYYAGKLNITQYWTLAFDETAGVSEDELVEGLASAFKKSVARRLADGKRHGLALSGGMDSRAILAAIGDKASQIPAFTFGTKGCDEIRIARTIARKLGMEHHVIELNPDELPLNFRDVIYLTDGMDYIGVGYLPLAYGEYRKHMDVLLHGMEGDVLLGEYFLNDSLLYAGSEDDIVRILYNGITIFPEDIRSNLLKPEYYAKFKELSLNSVRDEMRHIPEKQPGNRATHFAIRSIIWRTDLMGCVIGRNQVEEAYPFFDNDFIDWVLKIPPGLRVNYRIYNRFLEKLSPMLAGVTRQLTGVAANASPFMVKLGIYYQQGKVNLKQLLYQLSGGKIFLRNTFGYLSLSEFFLVNPNWRKAVQDIIADEQSLSRRYFNPGYIKRLLKRHGDILPPREIMRRKRCTVDYSLPLSFIIAFELFLKLFTRD